MVLLGYIAPVSNSRSYQAWPSTQRDDVSPQHICKERTKGGGGEKRTRMQPGHVEHTEEELC